MSNNSLQIFAIAAMDEQRVIGFQNKLPWSISEDLKRFSELTTGHTVLMGRKTFDSLPDAYRPLPNRKNVVITSSPSKIPANADIAVSDTPLGFIDAVESGDIELPSRKLWIIGGAQVYLNTMKFWDELYLTLVKGSHEGDTFFPKFENRMTLVAEEEHDLFSFRHYRGNHILNNKR